MYAPKGTLIAFATSPGETASDGTGNNGLYTSALLAHIEDENITIEELFKRVRNTVSAFSNGKQTSWEHTSLTGNFYFNSGQIISAKTGIYSEKAVADAQYDSTGTTLGEQIIERLKRYSWDYQNSAIGKIREIDPKKENGNTLFVLGRNILQSACGGSFSAQNFVQYISENIKRFNVDGKNHVLNGILFEIYFNREGKFRYDRLKACFMDDIMSIQKEKTYESSIQFIQDQLKPFNDYLFVVPSIPPQTVSFDIITEKKPNGEFVVKSVKWEGKDILVKDSNDGFFSTGEYFETMTYGALKYKIAHMLSIPFKQITFNSNDNLTDVNPVYFPLGHKLKKS
jgi:hypothetical protein